MFIFFPVKYFINVFIINLTIVVKKNGDKILKLLILFLSLTVIIFSAQPIPNDLFIDEELNHSLLKIVEQEELHGDFNVGEDGIEQISFAVIELNGSQPRIGGVNMDNFIYPASVYKMYVAAAVLKKISEGELKLEDNYVVQSPNDVDRSREISTDPRPLLRDGDTVTINYLIDLMITRSDNSAANCLIDIASRPYINEMMKDYGWEGSEVTRKFLNRKFEDPGYDTVRSTETSALHAADFMYRVFKNEMINPWVSMQLKTFLGRQLDKSKLAQGLPRSAMFYHKSGWWSYWTNDVGIVDDGDVKYIIALFTPVREKEILPKMKNISQKVFELMKERNN
jgi:beta-lactamase class A